MLLTPPWSGQKRSGYCSATFVTPAIHVCDAAMALLFGADKAGSNSICAATIFGGAANTAKPEVITSPVCEVSSIFSPTSLHFLTRKPIFTRSAGSCEWRACTSAKAPPTRRVEEESSGCGKVATPRSRASALILGWCCGQSHAGPRSISTPSAFLIRPPIRVACASRRAHFRSLLSMPMVWRPCATARPESPPPTMATSTDMPLQIPAAKAEVAAATPAQAIVARRQPGRIQSLERGQIGRLRIATRRTSGRRVTLFKQCLFFPRSAPFPTRATTGQPVP